MRISDWSSDVCSSDLVFQSHWRVPRKCGVDKAGDSEYTEQRQKCQRRFGKWGFTMFVIEGMDNSGKSTLAEAIASYMGLIAQESEGSPLDAREINDHVDRYEDMTDRMYVRHALVSNAIYGQVRERSETHT